MPPPPGYLNFAGLCTFVGASENTVRSVVRRLRVRPLDAGSNVTLYSDDQARLIRDDYAEHGGCYRPRKRARKSHSGVGTKD
jgi:hypothetical protein